MPENHRLGGGRAARTTPTRTPYIWVEDDSTGHRYDVLETAVRAGMTPVKDYPPNYTGRPRRPKHHTDLAGSPQNRAQGVTTVGDTDTGTADTGNKPTTSKGANK